MLAYLANHLSNHAIGLVSVRAAEYGLVLSAQFWSSRGGTILLYDAISGEALFLNSSGRIPAAVDSDVYREPTPGYRQNRRGAKAVSTPGNANAWEAMWQRYGRLDWPVLFSSAIATARGGFALDGRTAGSIERAFPSFPAHAQEFYGRDGHPLEAGDLLVQKDLARSFQLIAL